MNSFELGKATPNTNAVPGAKESSFFAVFESGKRVSIDAESKTIVIEEVGKTGGFSVAATDDTCIASLTGAVGKTAKLSAGQTDSLMDLDGAGGAVHLRTAECIIQGIDGLLPRTFAARVVKSCDASDPPGQSFVRGVIATPRIRVA